MKLFLILIIFGSWLIISSCNKRIEPYKLISINDTLVATVLDPLTSNINSRVETQILPNTAKHDSLIKWLTKNNSGWKSSVASYICKMSLHGNNLSLLYFETSVVLSFEDEQESAIQLTKTIPKGELDFIFLSK